MNPLNIVIIEDEPATARNLAATLKTIDVTINIAATLETVENAVEWFTETPDGYDLAFMDIRLADGISFDIFNHVVITRPVIFVTAYNDYAIQAFKNNGIGYVLKPFDKAEIADALGKYHQLTALKVNSEPLVDIIAQISQLTRSYKKSFLIHYRDKLIPVDTARIAWFYTANEIVYAQTTDARQYNIEFTMEQLDKQLDPAMFFRANRQFIVNRNAITEAAFYFNGRLSIKIKPEPPEHILISKARVPEFKRWMDA